MSTVIRYERFWMRRDTEANWVSVNPVLAAGEFGIVTDGAGMAMKMGDGSTAWNSLAYLHPQMATASGADTITATFDPKPVLVDGLVVYVKAAAANTTAVTFNPNSLGALAVKKHGGTALAAGEIAAAGHVLILVYRSSGTTWELLNPVAVPGAIGDQSGVTYLEGSAPATPASGKVITYAKTDGLMYSKDDAGTETLMSVGSGGAMTYVGSATVSGAAATTLAISGLDLDTHGRYYCELIADNATGSAAQVSLYYNADTTATNYNRQGVLANGTGVTAARGNDGILAVMDASENLVLTFTICNDFDSKARARSFGNYGASASLKLRDFAHSWTSTANVTGITIRSDVASSLAIGTVLKVWKIG